MGFNSGFKGLNVPIILGIYRSYNLNTVKLVFNVMKGVEYFVSL